MPKRPLFLLGDVATVQFDCIGIGVERRTACHGRMEPTCRKRLRRKANANNHADVLVVITGVAPISLYLLVPALPCAREPHFLRGISGSAPMTVYRSTCRHRLFTVIMGPLSDLFGRAPWVLLSRSLLMVSASVACVFRGENRPATDRARFLLQGLAAPPSWWSPRHASAIVYPR